MNLGAIHLMCDSPVDKWPVSNRGIWRIDPTRANGKNIFANYQGYFAGRVDPITNWLEGGATKESAIHDFERPFGSVGVWRKEWSIADGVESRDEGKTWLADFPLAARSHTLPGREIVAHMGGLELDGWAARVRGHNSWDASADALDLIRDTYAPLMRAGVVIGVDAASGSDANSADYGAVTLLRALGAEVQIESTPPLSAPHWMGSRCRMAWSQEFRWRHIEQDANSAKLYPLLGTPEFRAWYPGLRVSVFSNDFYGAGAYFWEPKTGAVAPEKAIRHTLENMAVVARQLSAGGCVPLLDATSIDMAILAKVSAREFLEGVK